jgi:hypothetical protein
MRWVESMVLSSREAICFFRNIKFFLARLFILREWPGFSIIECNVSEKLTFICFALAFVPSTGSYLPLFPGLFMKFEMKQALRRLVAGAGALMALTSWGTVASAAAPANDNIGSAKLIYNATGSVTGSNVDATGEGGEPRANNRTVWYRWKSPAAGIVTFDTFGSSFDSTLSAYTGITILS